MPTNPQEIIFQLDSTGDDFTFYLDYQSNKKVIEAFENLSQREGEDDQKKKKRLSFSEEVSFTNQILEKGSVSSIEDEFWTRLKNEPDPSSCSYLLDKLRVQNEAAAQLIAKIRSGPELTASEKLAFLKLLNDSLTGEIFDDIVDQSWSATAPFSEDDKPLLDALKGDEQHREKYKRFLVAAFFPEFTWKTERGRGLICYSHAGQYLSVTVRRLKTKSGYKAKFFEKEEDRRDYLFSPGEYCEQLYKQLFEKEPSQTAQGLLVVTGSTNSLKSEIARGLIDLYLTNREKETTEKDKKPRRLHLVTFEDPIERFYSREDIRGYRLRPVELSTPINYTPRQRHKDVGALREALNDALRQTPALFFVGETRDKEEWEVLLDFAATGHLIVTTAHAGSLVEAMNKIFEARNTQTSADRAEIASKLLGLIHLRGCKVVFDYVISDGIRKPMTTNTLIPALWRHTSRGVASLTSDGLASLLPHRPPSDKDITSCLGRRWFVEQLTGKAKESLRRVFGEHSDQPFASDQNGMMDSISVQLNKRASEWDLQGV